MAGFASNPNKRPGSGLKVKPGFKVDPSKTGLTAPGGSGPTPTEKPKGANTRGIGSAGNQFMQPGGSGPSPKAGFRNGSYVDVPDAIKDRGKKSPESYTQKQARVNASVGKGSRAAPADRVRTMPRGEDKTKPSPTDGTPGAPRPTKDPKVDTTPKDPTPGGSSSSSTSSSSSSSSSSTSSTPQRQTRPGASGEKKMAPAPPGSLNFYMRKAAQAGDKDVKRRAYQMWENSKKSPGKSLSAGMNVAQKDLPANPKKGDAVKGRGGVTWTWNGTRWSRGKAK